MAITGDSYGSVMALNTADGKTLWHAGMGEGMQSSPISYELDGRQYIAVCVGWGGWTEGFLPAMLGAGHGDALFAFALP